ncbi:MAG: hypothetical protein AAFR12_03885 [Cyanobacteria bacterium J06626_6]
MAGKRRIDLTVAPPPELAIEVDVTSATQLQAYQGLGVAELWRFDAGVLRIRATNHRKAKKKFRQWLNDQKMSKLPKTQL